jgi:short-subunit dehydrogenase
MTHARQRILITGASSGLGAEMARQFAALGRDLALCARRTDRLEQLRAQLLTRHPSATVVIASLDVTDSAAVFSAFPRMAAELGGLDRVIVNAGIGDGARVGTGGFEANRRTLQTNLVAALAQAEAACQLFRAAGDGHLVLISSLSALRGFAGTMTAYAASKAGLRSLGEGIASELHGTGIRVSTLLPGYINTELTHGHGPFVAGTVRGGRAMVRALEAERAPAGVPAWPWRPIGVLLRRAPAGAIRRFT